MNLLFPLFAALKLSPSDIGYSSGFTNEDSAILLTLNFVYVMAGIVCVVVLIVSGYLFVTARGDPSQMKRAKDSIRSAVIGIVVVSVAFTVTQFILGRLK